MNIESTQQQAALLLEHQSEILTEPLKDLLAQVRDDTFDVGLIHGVIGAYLDDAETAPDVIEEMISWDSKSNAREATFVKLGREFFIRWLGELREIICNKKRQGEFRRELGDVTPAALISGTLLQLGLAEPVALGLSTMVVYAILKATKGAFCRMTDGEVLKSFSRGKNNGPKPRQRARAVEKAKR